MSVSQSCCCYLHFLSSLRFPCTDSPLTFCFKLLRRNTAKLETCGAETEALLNTIKRRQLSPLTVGNSGDYSAVFVFQHFSGNKSCKTKRNRANPNIQGRLTCSDEFGICWFLSFYGRQIFMLESHSSLRELFKLWSNNALNNDAT